MSQHDLEIANQGFAAFRQDLNDALQALGGLQSGATEPATTYANMFWYETDTDKLYIRNEDNDAWIELFTFDQVNDHLATIGASITLDGSGNVSIDNGDFTVDTDTLVVDASSDYVGINIASPAQELVVYEATEPRVALQNSSSGTGATDGFQIQSNSSNTFLWNYESAGILFGTNGTERMRIASNGNLGVGTTSTGTYRLYLVQSAASTVAALRCNGSDYANMVTFFAANGSAKGTISATPTSVSYNTSSDYRLKENAVGISDGITRVKQLQPKRFNFIGYTDTTVDGFIAHEAQSVVPEAVHGAHNGLEAWTQDEIDAGDAPANTSAGDNKLDDDGNTIPLYQGIDQAKLVPLLTAALQEAIAKIETLETQAVDFETRIAALESA